MKTGTTTSENGGLLGQTGFFFQNSIFFHVLESLSFIFKFSWVRLQRRTRIATTDPFPRKQRNLYYNPDTLNGFTVKPLSMIVALTAQHSLFSPSWLLSWYTLVEPDRFSCHEVSYHSSFVERTISMRAQRKESYERSDTDTPG
jgi:hypothetical protein